MPNMRDIRLRMKSVTQTLQITSAMKLISTSKLRRARAQLAQTEPYFDRIQETVRDIFLHSAEVREDYLAAHRNEDGKTQRAFLVITSDKGMAGGFNHNVIRLAEEQIVARDLDFFVLLGNIGSRYFMKSESSILETFRFSSHVPTVYDAKEISDFVLSQYDAGKIDEFYIVYTRMYSSVKLVPEVLKVLPLDEGMLREGCGTIADAKGDSSLTYVPSPAVVLESLIPKYLCGVVYGAIVESYASEHSARMTAMDNATKNAEEMLGALRLSYNRLRQGAITQEVTEIVAGAAALNS
jgi:F-type H+-transporting ATPase subunit gamma